MMTKKGRKTMLIIGIVALITATAIFSVCKIRQEYKFNIERQNVTKINIEYWGADYSKEVVNSYNIDTLVNTLNSLSLRKRRNPHLDIRSGPLAITMYNSHGKEVDYFYIVVDGPDYSGDWVYRRSPAYNGKKGNRGYYSGNQINSVYDVCNVIAPFRGD